MGIVNISIIGFSNGAAAAAEYGHRARFLSGATELVPVQPACRDLSASSAMGRLARLLN